MVEKTVDLKNVWDGIKRNMKILDECVGPHEWEPIDNPHGQKRFVCKKCGGDIDMVGKEWYQKGLAHGRKSV